MSLLRFSNVIGDDIETPSPGRCGYRWRHRCSASIRFLFQFVQVEDVIRP
ncbi:MAG: hypothetical protein R2789_02040 [Microthrixaceae bacterium]